MRTSTDVQCRAVLGALGLATLFNGVVRTDLLGRTMLIAYWRNDVPVAEIFIAGAPCLRLRSTFVTNLVSPVASDLHPFRGYCTDRF